MAELHACLEGFVCLYSVCPVSATVCCVCMHVGRKAVGSFYIKPADMHNDPVTCMHLQTVNLAARVVYPQHCGKQQSAECSNGLCIFT